MKSDVVKVTSAGEGTEEALTAACATAAYRGLSQKETLQLRLLTEETLGMLRRLTGKKEAEFWAASEGRAFELHLVARPIVTGDMRNELLKVSTSGKNAAATGFMGKLRDIFDRALVGGGSTMDPAVFAQGYVVAGDAYMVDAMPYVYSTATALWSMQKYKAACEQAAAAGKEADEWDELEKSIVANLADEVTVAITGDKVEMTVYKKFDH
ncbi:MAG: hypothetical protein II776_01635 [Clostridia bacterium]|nr:hypothetical protein [Clostridia bacterium]